MPRKMTRDARHPTLYDPIDGPDNYGHDGLFRDLQTNPYPCTWTVWNTILKSSRYMAQFTAVCVFHVIYFHLSVGNIQPVTILYSCLVLSILAYFFGNFCADLCAGRRPIPPTHFRKEHLRLYITFLLFSYQMAPVLRSLTVEISSNTIRYIAGTTTLVHLTTSFYGIDSFMTSNAISVNSAIIGSICLTSRVASDFHCFTTLVLTFQIYILFPIFGRLFWDTPVTLIASLLIGSLVTYTISTLTLLLFMTSIIIGSGVLPTLMVYALRYKNNIYGPWDEAVIEPYVRPSRIKVYDPYR